MKKANVKAIKEVEMKKAIASILKKESSKSLKVKNLFDLGLEVKEIAGLVQIRYNFAYNVISNYIIIEGLEVENTKKDSKIDLVRTMFKANKSCKEIAIELRTSQNYIYKLIKQIKEEEVLEAK